MTKTALIMGCGDDTGAAVARAFAREGLHVCLSRRPRCSLAKTAWTSLRRPVDEINLGYFPNAFDQHI